MLIKKCEKCGAEFPGETNYRICRVCKTKFKMGWCTTCKRWSDLIDSAGRCRPCNNKYRLEKEQRRKRRTEEVYKEWKDNISKIPMPYKFLTEDEWMAACRHFGVCAYCRTRDIEARSLFISFKEGGRYCAWNVVPACEKCETSLKATINPFKRMDEQIFRENRNKTKKLGYSRANLQGIVDYLKPKLEEAINEA